MKLARSKTYFILALFLTITSLNSCSNESSGDEPPPAEAAVDQQIQSSDQPGADSKITDQQPPTNVPLKTEPTPETTPTPTPAPVLTASLAFGASSHDFGLLLTGASDETTATLTNSGDGAGTGLSGNLPQSGYDYKGGAFPGTGGDCTTELASSSSCSIVITTTSEGAGDFAHTFTVSYDDGTATATTDFELDSSYGDPAVLSLNSNADYQFGDTAPDTAVGTTLTVENTGGYPASSIALSVGLSLPFYFPGGYPGTTATCTDSLAPGSTCNLYLKFAPSSIGSFNDSFTLSYNDGSTGQTSARGVSGDSSSLAFLTVSEDPEYDFGSVEISGSDTKHLVMTNTGQASATTVGSTSLSAPFSFLDGSYPGTGGTCTSTLSAAAQCTVVVEFSPSAAGSFSDQVQVDYNNGLSDQSVSRTVKGSASDIHAKSQSVTTGSSNKSFDLAATGGGAKTYAIVIAPDNGTLDTSGLPTAIYTPDAGFSGMDTFTFNADDGVSTSNTAEVRIFVNPKALFVVNNSASLNPMDVKYNARLAAAGFTVTLVSAGPSTTADADGMDFVAVSESVSSGNVNTKFVDVQMPFVTWERWLWDDMKMSEANQSNNGLIADAEIEIVDSTHTLADGNADGSLTVLSSAAQIPYLIETNDNIQKVATIDGDAAKVVMFAYESQMEMVGGKIAPARRLGMFLPNGGGDTNATGDSLIDTSINYLMSGVASVMRDHFQVADSSTISGWSESESAGATVEIDGAKVLVSGTNESNYPILQKSFESHSSGKISATFRFDFAKSGSDTDYEFWIQLGNGDLMNTTNMEDNGVAVNLKWAGINDGMTGEEGFGHVVDGTTTELATVNSGEIEIKITADLDSNTYEITIDGATTAGIAFENSVDIDTIRFFGDSLNSTDLSASTIDNIRVFKGK